LNDGSTVPTGTVKDTSADDTTLGAAGTALASSFHLKLETLKASYPFKLHGGTAPDEYEDYNYADDYRETSAYLGSDAYFNSSHGSSFLAGRAIVESGNEIRPAGVADRRFFFLASAFRPTEVTDMVNVMKNAVTMAVQTFFEGTRQTISGYNIKPMPQVVLGAPRSGAIFKRGDSLTLKWSQNFKRADGEDYISGYTYDRSAAPSAGGPVDLYYYVKVKNLSLGTAWQMATIVSPTSSQGTVPTPGTEPYGPGVVPDSSVTPLELAAATADGEATWDTGSVSPGDYLVRIEAYRKDPEATAPGLIPVNYAFHEVKISLL
jgi:hypothetical protein